MKTQTPPSRWLLRKTTSYSQTDANKAIVTVDLIYGYEEKNRITGDVYHSLTGPTALKSISQLVEEYNRTGKTPPVRSPRARIDGWKQNKKTELEELLPEYRKA